MRSKKLTLTVGITALNEEGNITNILKSILSQRHNNHVLKQIMVVSDGSTDDTVKRARGIRSNKIKVFEFKNREGMAKRLNFMFKRFKTDIFVKIDADLLPVNKNLLNEISNPFLNDTKVGLVGGKLIAKNTDRFVQRVVNTARLTWDGIKNEYMEGNSFYSLPGGIYAISKRFAKHATFPETIWADVGYIYYSCKINNFNYVSNKKALVFLNLPVSIKDYINQVSRYSTETDALVKIFGNKIKGQFYIPKKILYKHKTVSLLKYPVECLVLFFVNIYIKLTNLKSINANANWQLASSTKTKI